MLDYLVINLHRSMNLKIFKNNIDGELMYMFYTKNFKIYVKYLGNKVYFDKKTNSFRIAFLKNKEINDLRRKILRWRNFLFFLICWKRFKISYTGKGYKIKRYKYIGFLDFTFGACHFVKALIKNYRLRFRRKKAIVVYYKNPFFLTKSFNKITNIKLINLYTQRGLWNSKKIIYRKPKNKAVYI